VQSLTSSSSRTDSWTDSRDRKVRTIHDKGKSNVYGITKIQSEDQEETLSIPQVKVVIGTDDKMGI